MWSIILIILYLVTMNGFIGSLRGRFVALTAFLVLGIGLFSLTSCSCDSVQSLEKGIYKAIEAKDYAKAQKKLEKMWDLVDSWSALPSEVRTYWTAYFDLLNAEINHLIDDSDDNTVTVDRLVGLIQNQRTGILPPYVGVTSDNKVIKANEKYNEVASRINASLDGAIQRAIAKRNRYLATSIVKCYKPILVKEASGNGILDIFLTTTYSFSYSYDAMNAAEAMVNNAIENGQL